MIFKKGNRIRHRNCLDIDLDIERIYIKSDNYVMAEVRYWNRHYKIYSDPRSETVTIMGEDYDKWSLVENDTQISKNSI